MESQRKIYLDNSSTTVVCDEAIKKIIEVMKFNYANPSSLHSMGFAAENEIDCAKSAISKKINCLPEEIYFTSGGTESNNLAIQGATLARKRLGNRIVTTSFEHSSVIENFKNFEKAGFEVVFVDPEPDGTIAYDKIFNAVNEKTILVSMMMVNNEVGSVLSVDELRKIVNLKKSPAAIHVDAVQAFCKIPINVKKLKVDLMSMSAHKIHGPKGVGALYISKGVKINPIFFGGKQQNKIRPGTEASQLIAGFAEAVKLESSYDHVLSLRDYCVDCLMKFENVELNSNIQSIPYILNVSFKGIKSETMLHYLASKNIFVSSGSACAKGGRSHVLEKLGFPEDRIDSAIRISFSRYNTKEDVDVLIDALKKANVDLVKRRM